MRSPFFIELAAQLRLALPLAATHLGFQLFGFVDTALLGHFDRVALAGAGVATSVLNALTMFGVGIVMGLDTLVPQALGAGEKEEAHRLFHSGVRVALLVALPLTAIAAGTPLLLTLFDVDPEVRSHATPYILARLPSILPQLLWATQRSFLQAIGRTRPLVIAIVVGNVFNGVFDWVLIHGDAALETFGLPAIGLPPLGAAGAGITTSVVTVALAVIGGYSVRAVLPVRGSAWEPRLVRSILRLGVPVGLQLLAEVGVFALTAVLAGRLGSLAAGGHQVAISLASASYNGAVGVAAATSVRVGLAIGAGDADGTRRAARAGMLVAVAGMGLAAVLFVAAPAALAHIFTGDPLLIGAAVPLIQIAAAFSLSDAVQAVGAGALRGAGDTRATFVANLIGHYAIGMPVATALAFAAGMGAAGLWWGLSVGLTVVAVALVARFVRLARRTIARSQ